MDSIIITITTGTHSQTAVIESAVDVCLCEMNAEAHIAVEGLMNHLLADIEMEDKITILPFDVETMKFNIDGAATNLVDDEVIAIISSKYDIGELTEEDMVNLANFYTYALENELPTI